MRLFYFRTAKKYHACIYGLVKMYVIRWPLCWTTFNMILAIWCKDKLLGFQRALIEFPWLQRYFVLLLEGLYDVSIWVKYTLLSFNLVKPIPLILKSRFWTCNCPCLMILFQPKFMINVTILILKLSIFHFYNVTFLALHPMEFIFLKSSDLLEHLTMVLAITLAINC